MLGALPLTMLPFLLPLYTKQFGATALGIGGLFVVAQGMMVPGRPVVGGWVYDTWGHLTPLVLTGVVLRASLGWVPLLLRGQSLGGEPHDREGHAVS